ncbi:hypothetical protein VI26_01165 [Chromobacterium sp. LK1]|uniref:hypothetical protein n=1 Tax=Chromobacterium sp. LK1 TaxID=1628193 RepID=UPI00065D9A30|nr:hypothetical protein [Chromobacterium sp. LK1]KMN38378.1 hypothetical protein VI26_01165 [Chromobacterium sp. LK1]
MSAWHWLGYSTACNAAIGLFFYWLGGKGSLADNLLISMCIGYGCWLGCTLLSLRDGRRHLAWYLLVAALSVPLGFKLAAWFGAVDVLAPQAPLTGNVWRVLGPALQSRSLPCCCPPAISVPANWRWNWKPRAGARQKAAKRKPRPNWRCCRRR